MENSILKRIKEFQKKEGYPKARDFCNKIGVSIDTYNTLFKRDSTPKLDFIANIKGAFEHCDLNWLITGNINGYKPKYNYECLQHYTTAYGLIHILDEMKLRFSEHVNSNDIKERRLAEHDEVKRKKQLKKEDVAQYKWVSFFVKDENRAFRQPKMFDMYADLHRGACIEFNKTKLLGKKENLNVEEHNVIYETSQLKQQDTVKEEIRHKFYQWSDENEYRIIYKGNETALDITGCISKIYLGCQFYDNDIADIAEFCRVIEKHNFDSCLISELKVSGIGFLYDPCSDSISPGQTLQTKGENIKGLIPYLSHEYREKHDLKQDVEYRNVNISEERRYKQKYFMLLAENRDLRIKIDTFKNNSDWLFTGDGNTIKQVQQKEVTNNQGIVGVQGDGNTIMTNGSKEIVIKEKERLITEQKNLIDRHFDEFRAELTKFHRIMLEKDEYIRSIISQMTGQNENNMKRIDALIQQISIIIEKISDHLDGRQTNNK
jgi:hypothetical protein